MSDTLTPDICVIGAGSGGLTVAAAAASFGVPVVLIEKGAMGGDCLNTGCVPSKALIAAAKHAHAFSTGEPFGIAAQVPGIDFAKVNAHVHDVIAGIAPHDSEERFESLGVTVIRAEARFTGRDTVVAGDTTIKARRFVVAAGSSPAVPPIDGLADVPYLTNETVFDLKACPEHMIVVGGGPIGIEMAQAHRRLGARVTVLEAAKALPKDDPENAAVVLDTIRAEGVDLREGVTVKSVAKNAAGIVVTVGTGEGTGERIAGSHILVAAGRRPNLAGLNLDAAGIAADKKGISVDAGLRTSNRRIYAIGDIAGGLQFTHVAGYHAGLVIRSILFRLPVKVKTPIIPWVTYTDPELAQIGLTEDAARKEHGDAVTVITVPFTGNDRARAERRTEGRIKVVAGKGGRILGVSIVGVSAGDLIATWALAVSAGLKLRDLTGFVAPYPTFSEVSRRAAVDYYAPGAKNPWVQRLVRWLRVFG
ncbi:pyruvate/2-oxoglutarate dehydrogenase complex dihydrolipoamide dehydrogenase (E3) component [Rhodobium orientis]|uniref:Dihydrolipoamide dehydrogenase n=1 Tax=Rhodobium orientis TaxID=34017 RepID=A0A327JXC3_9HYPH|nr:FAD-dependent oxidoreductase [Rhodobium orientis]MBB4304686.1 pyruvate/2-oxoglutarate dehydrogenase complex dihydrolipoamide dehydrogenase (E3) component [Rhodobium orientis]MBK5950062.1 dihydrolipoamide dehydrogenase [Rhodobium orientis]RAI27748.1 dihydrolipoamide dehydrogenase [Rhodobium orientis]